MNPKMNVHKFSVAFTCCVLTSVMLFSQPDTSTFKAQFALGINSPSTDGFVQDYQGKSVNFPTANLGLQYMFMPVLGLKLDYGFSRITNDESANDFKLNYSRANLQLVIDASRLLAFSNRMGVFFHVGPGYSFVKPLGNFGNNDTSFFNIMGGVEFHYGVSDRLTLYLDTAYILGSGDDFNPVSNGFGAFNGNLLTVTFGASISLTGCYFCGD